MKKWEVFGTVIGSQFLGVFEADTEQQAAATARLSALRALSKGWWGHEIQHPPS